MVRVLIVSAAVLVLSGCAARLASPPQTPQDWVALGTQVHGGFGTLIALGVRVGQAGLRDLGALPREVDVTYFDGPQTPCACVADGILIATSASPGQGTLRVAAEKAPAGQLATVVIRHRKDNRQVRYVIPMSVMPKMAGWNKELDPLGRYDVVMKAPEAELFRREN
jgi:formylmethanofuran dehydrogenase subunit E